MEKEFGLEESLAKTEEFRCFRYHFALNYLLHHFIHFRRSRNKELEEQGFLTVGAFGKITRFLIVLRLMNVIIH